MPETIQESSRSQAARVKPGQIECDLLQIVGLELVLVQQDGIVARTRGAKKASVRQQIPVIFLRGHDADAGSIGQRKFIPYT
jgi:hypothetical protein